MADPANGLARIINEFSGTDFPTASPTFDPYADAIQQAQATYPRIKSIPFALTVGKGPGMSETYEPDEKGEGGNPFPGKWTVQLRNPEVIQNRSIWPDYIALESLHPLYAQDKGYQQLTQQFVKSMTPDQLADARKAYKRDTEVFGVTESFDKWIGRVQAQEYIRGMLFPKVIKNWLGPSGEGRYTPNQLKLGRQIDQYLRSAQ